MQKERKTVKEDKLMCQITSVVSDSFETPWTVAHQTPLSMGILQARIYWSGLPCPPARDLPDPGIEPASLTSPMLASGFFSTSTTLEDMVSVIQDFSKRKKKSHYLSVKIQHLF